MGLLKSETAEKRIAGVIALQPKCYCLKLEGDSTKLAAKGVPNHHQRLLRYENYDEIYKGIKSSHDVVVTNIVSKNARPVTRRIKKRGLFLMDLKRFYINANKSFGYSHPEIPSTTPMDIEPTTKKRKYTDNGSSNSVFIAGNKKMKLMGKTVFNLNS